MQSIDYKIKIMIQNLFDFFELQPTFSIFLHWSAGYRLNGDALVFWGKMLKFFIGLDQLCYSYSVPECVSFRSKSKLSKEIKYQLA